MRSRRKYSPWSKPVDATVEIDDVEFEVAVQAYYQEEERDTNTQAGLEIEAVYHEDNGCVMHLMSEEDVDRLAEDLLERYAGWGDEE